MSPLVPRLIALLALTGAVLTLPACAPDDASGTDTTDAATDGLRVTAVQPADGSVDVARDARIVLTFSDAVDPATLLPGTIALTPEAPADLSWDEGARQVTVQPRTALTADTTYRLNVTTGVTDAAGDPLGAAFESSFTTGAGFTAPTGEARSYTFDTPNQGTDTVTVTPAGSDPLALTYAMTTTAPLRDSLPPDGRRSVVERPDAPVLRSGDPLFDALFAMALDDARLCEVNSITDGAFNNGNGVDCDCYETGEKWTYVWTRDTAYAVDLGLYWTDPVRAANSLRFKLSRPKDSVGGGPLQIVQDTGSGGSWPVSTDRVIWALGARAVLPWLPQDERASFAADALEAMQTTLAVDRASVYDPRDGLYRGEQSFLDWREQSYPTWTANDVGHLAQSKALSTNAGHHILLTFAAELALDAGLTSEAATYQAWADDLAQAMRGKLWLDDVGWFGAMTGPELDPSVQRRTDLLGLSLTVLEDIATPAQASTAVSTYPHAVFGPPVLHPQQPVIPIYHNRGMWPFVTAYGALSAKKAGNDAVFTHDLSSLARGAALNLSNMENFEFVSQRAFVDDGAYSGPVVNSRRQLWSVAGYLGAIVRGLYGIEATTEGLTFDPFVPAEARDAWFSGSSRVSLHRFPWRDGQITVHLDLPTSAEGTLVIDSATHNGQPFDPLTPLTPGEGDEIVLTLTSVASTGSLTTIDDPSDFKQVFAPQEPGQATLTANGGQLDIAWPPSPDAAQGITYTVYRDGEPVAEGLSSPSYTDAAVDVSTVSPCYAIEAVFDSSGHASHHSPPACWWGTEGARIQTLGIERLAASGADDASWVLNHGRVHYQDWGGDGEVLAAWGVQPDQSGLHLIQPVFGNGAGAVNTGITAGTKRLVVQTTTGQAVASGVVVMHHMGPSAWDIWADGSFVEAHLEADQTYTVTLVDEPNMSYLDHFTPYTAGSGGGTEAFGRVNISELKVLAKADLGPVVDRSLPFDPAGGRAAHAGESQLTSTDLANPSSFDSAGAFTVTADHLIVSLRSDAFADPYSPLMIYLQAGDKLGPAVPGQGLEYSGVTPALPFVATHVITARRAVDAGPQGGPWSGIWTLDSTDTTQRTRLVQGDGLWISAANDELTVVVPVAALGLPSEVRLAWHTQSGTSFFDRFPATFDPAGTGGGFWTVGP